MLIERGRIIKCEVYWMISVLMITVLAFGGCCCCGIVLTVMEMTDKVHVGSQWAKTQNCYQQEMYKGSSVHREIITILLKFYTP